MILGNLQGILGVFLREPLAEWQREARILRRIASRAITKDAPADEDAHLALKACLHCPHLLCRDSCSHHSRQQHACTSCKLRCRLGIFLKKWVAGAQVEHVRHKLQGRHPADILLAELAPRHGSAKYWKALQVGPCINSQEYILPG